MAETSDITTRYERANGIIRIRIFQDLDRQMLLFAQVLRARKTSRLESSSKKEIPDLELVELTAAQREANVPVTTYSLT